MHEPEPWTQSDQRLRLGGGLADRPDVLVQPERATAVPVVAGQRAVLAHHPGTLPRWLYAIPAGSELTTTHPVPDWTSAALRMPQPGRVVQLLGRRSSITSHWSALDRSPLRKGPSRGARRALPPAVGAASG